MPKETDQIIYTITLTEQQIRVTQNALEEYFRLRMGQQRDFCDDLAHIGRSTATDKAFDAFIARRDHLEEIMRAFFKIAFEPIGYLKEKTDDMMIAETIWDTMRFARGESRWDKPFQVGPEPCPKIERTEV